MLPVSRNVAFVLFATLALGVCGCSSNAKKIVGKWKITAVGDEKGKGMEGISLFVEFKSDGTGAASIEASDPKAQEFVKMLNEKPPTFSWTVSGNTVELTSTSKEKGEGVFGKNEKAKFTLKFEGDTLTLTPEDKNDKTATLTRVK